MQNATWATTTLKQHCLNLNKGWKNFSKPVTDQIARAQILKRVEVLARLLDDAFVLPGTNYRIGWDGIIGLVPGVGDAATTALSAYIVWEAKRLGVSRWTLLRMSANVLIDFIVGAIPALGDLFDVAFKANRRNLALLRRALRNEAAWTNSPVRGLQLMTARAMA